MAEVVIEIKTSGYDSSSAISDKSSNLSTNNISKNLNQSTTSNNGKNGISMAGGKISLANGYFGNGGVLQSEISGYNGYAFGPTNNNGELELTITLTGTNIQRVVFVGDKNANQYPTRAIMNDSKYISNDNVTWFVDFETPNNTQTIKFTNWNRPNYNACFTEIKVIPEYLSFSKYDIEALSSLSQSTSDASLIKFGPLANSGLLEMKDYENQILKLLDNNIIDDYGTPINIYLNNNLIQTHISTDTTYSGETKKVGVSLSNIIDDFSKTHFNGIRQPVISTAYKLLYDILNSYYSGSLSLTDYDEMLDELIIADEVNSYINLNNYEVERMYNYLRRITFLSSYIDSDNSYFDAINDLCSVAQIQMYVADNGKLKFTSSRPLLVSDNYIDIPKSIQYSDIEESIILKNKYDGVQLSLLDSKIDNQFSIFKSDQLQIFDSSNNFIGNTDVNPSEYTITKDNVLEEIHVEYSLDLNKIKGDFDTTSSGINNIKIIVAQENHNYTYNVNIILQNNSVTIDNGVSSQELIYTISDGPNTIQINNNILTINFSFGYGLRDGAYQNGSHPYHYTNSLQFEIITTAYVYENKTITSNNFDTAKNTLSINKNKLIQEFYGDDGSVHGTGISRIPMPDNPSIVISPKLISQSIIKDILSAYSNGIHTVQLKICCSDLNYYKDSTLAKNYNNGEILKVGDIVSYKSDSGINGKKIFKITGRKFEYESSPYIKLELQENIPAFNTSYLGGVYILNLVVTHIYGKLTIPEYYNDGMHGLSKIYGIGDGDSPIVDTDVKGIDIPKSVNVIYHKAFKDCNQVSKIFIPATVLYIYYDVFSGWNPNAKIYCESLSQPDGYTENWNHYSFIGALDVIWGVSREEFDKL